MTYPTVLNDQALNDIANFCLPTGEIGFGKVMLPFMLNCDYADGEWGKLTMLPYGPLEFDPTAKVLHYGQEIFEGMKAYAGPSGQPHLFRPLKNWERFNQSARRMAMPEVPQELFMRALQVLVHYGSPFIPQDSGSSLYIRPFMLATETHLGIKPSTQFKLLFIASPSGSYFAGDVKVYVEQKARRAVPGGVGTAKTGGNYAASLLTTQTIQAQGFDQVLWLDPQEGRYIEELSGMNFFAVINGELHTPKLTDTILAGITRDSLLKLAPTLGLKVHERKIALQELLGAIQKGHCTEAFACGTASIVGPIAYFGLSQDELYPLPEKTLTMKLREKLLGIQEARMADEFQWLYPIEGSK